MLLSGCEFSVYDLPLPGGADLGDNPFEVIVEFRDVLDLVPQSTVKVDDVSVGIVDDVELDGYTAEVTLLLNEDVELPDNAEATIRQTSLLGEKFVSLAPPASNPSPNTLERRRRHRAREQRPEHRGRRGPRRPVAGAQRRWRGPAEDDQHASSPTSSRVAKAR